ncbi:hypothetical protein Leryth_000658 [Lithospermum erythrorhizon]|nr:hypothetical protein Leryth_000658 [Lithospermum erythrorhizon]
MGRAPCCEKVGLKRGRWTTEEDEILTKYIQLHGEGSWRSLPKNAGRNKKNLLTNNVVVTNAEFEGLLRCGKSCRLRWINYLRSDLKRGNFTAEEENLIIKLHATMGNRWSLIAGNLPGRTDNEIKNYWNSHLSRKIDTFIRRRLADPNNTMIASLAVMESVNKNDGVPKKRRGGRTSRSAMKKTKEYRASNIVGVPKLPSNPLPSKAPKDAHNTTSSQVAIMPATPKVDKENSILSSAISWSEENLESFFTESYSIDDVLQLDDIRGDADDKLVASNETCLAESREMLDNSNNGTILTFDDENLPSLGLLDEMKMVDCDGESGTMEVDNMLCNLSHSENQENGQLDSCCPKENGQLGSWYLDSPVLSMMDDEGQIGNFEILECDIDSTTRGNEEEGILSWLWDTCPSEGECYNQNGDEFVDVEKQNAMISWLLS